jgi:CelD/BcsL family acetyltransferase involved in cellulose biosynthesis
VILAVWLRSMRANVLPLRDLPASLKHRWREIQQNNPALAGPCFRPELFTAIGQFRRDAFVAVLEEGQPQGFLPFLRTGLLPIAKSIPMCDYQAIICTEARSWDVSEVLEAAGLLVWDFECLVGLNASGLAPSSLRHDAAPRVDLHGGLKEYYAHLERQGRRLKHLARSRRFLQRDWGPLRYVPACGEPENLRRLLAWKADRFSQGQPIPAWVVEVLELLWRPLGPDLRGVLSVLYAGDTLVAAHFGIQCQGVLHYWFPAFNPEYAKYSPGWILLQELIDSLEASHCRVLDLGPGGERYKAYFCNAMLPTWRGCFEAPSLLSWARGCQRQALAGIRATPWLHRGLGSLRRLPRRLKKAFDHKG